MSPEQLRKILRAAVLEEWEARSIQRPDAERIADRHVYCDCSPEVWAARCADCGRDTTLARDSAPRKETTR